MKPKGHITMQSECHLGEYEIMKKILQDKKLFFSLFGIVVRSHSLCLLYDSYYMIYNITQIIWPNYHNKIIFERLLWRLFADICRMLITQVIGFSIWDYSKNIIQHILFSIFQQKRCVLISKIILWCEWELRVKTVSSVDRIHHRNLLILDRQNLVDSHLWIRSS